VQKEEKYIENTHVIESFRTEIVVQNEMSRRKRAIHGLK